MNRGWVSGEDYMGRAARGAGGQVRAYLDSSRCTRRSVPNEESVYDKQASCEGGSRATIFIVLLVLASSCSCDDRLDNMLSEHAASTCREREIEPPADA